MPIQPRTRVAAHARDSNLPPSGSQTITSTPTNGSGSDDQGRADGYDGHDSLPGEIGVLRLRGGPVRNQRVVWAEEVVDNEGMGRKSSKICCIYHKPRAFDESSSESSSSSSSSSDESDNGGDPSRPPLDPRWAKKAEKGSGDDSESDGGLGDGGARPPPKQPKSRRPNRVRSHPRSHDHSHEHDDGHAHSHTHRHHHRDHLTHDRRHVHTAECEGMAEAQRGETRDGEDGYVEVIPPDQRTDAGEGAGSDFERIDPDEGAAGGGQTAGRRKGKEKGEKGKGKSRAFLDMKPNYLERGIVN